MRSLSILALAALLPVSACSFQAAKTPAADSVSTQSSPTSATEKLQAAANRPDPQQGVTDDLRKVAEKPDNNASFDRKIIRNADLTIDVASTPEAQQQITAIAESHGGFVVTSEARQRPNVDPSKRTVDIKVVVRVPANQFSDALGQIERLAKNIPQRNINSQDVTEEFIDLEARIKTQKALELQFLEIMKQARKIEDALEVQRQIADVRTEIEKLEGRKHFLENRASLSTITINLQTPVPIVVSTAGFTHTIREAVSESIDLGSAIFLFFVRFIIMMIPVAIFFLLPMALIAIYFRRRAQRMRLAAELAVTSQN